MSQVNVSHYGIHWAEGPMAFMEQGKNLAPYSLMGSKIKSPFTVGANFPCNHAIPHSFKEITSDQDKEFARLMEDPLVQAMLPIPREAGKNVYYVDHPEGEGDLTLALTVLSRMSSPVQPPFTAVWMISKNMVANLVRQTNVQPLVLTQTAPVDTPMLTLICGAAKANPRTLVFSGEDDVPIPPWVQRITTNLCDEDMVELNKLPWASFGARELLSFMEKT